MGVSRIPRRQYITLKTAYFEKHIRNMASDRMWGGLPFIVPSRTAMKYLYHAKVINEDDVPVGAHYRAREDMLNNVRGYRIVKKGLSRRLTDIEHERRRAKSEVPFISTSGVSASTLSTGDEYWQPMDPIYYYNKSTCFRPILTRCPIFKNRVTIGRTEPRMEEFIGHVNILKKMAKNPSEAQK